MLSFVLVFTIYVMFIFFVSYKLQKRIKDQDGYFIAGRNIGLPVATLGYTSNYMAVVFAGAQTAYTVGISGMWYPVIFGLSATGLALLIAGPFRKMGLYTLPEYLSRRYSVTVGITAGCIIVVQSFLANPVSALSTMGGIVEYVFLLPPQWGILLAAVVSLVVMLLSGWYGTMYINSLHIVVGATALLLSVGLSLGKIGGANALISSAPPGAWNLAGIGLMSIMTIIITYTLNIFVAAIAFQSIASTVGPREARQAILIGGPVAILLGILGAILGVEASILYPGEVALSAIAKTVFNSSSTLGVFLGMGIFVGMFPALTSTMMSSVTILIRDIYGQLTTSTPSDGQYIRFSRISLLIMMFVAYIITLFWNEELMKLGLFSFAFRSAPLAPLMVLGFFWRRSSSRAALVSVLASSGIMISWFILGFPFKIHPLYPGLIVSVLLFVILSLFSDPEEIDEELLLRKDHRDNHLD